MGARKRNFLRPCFARQRYGNADGTSRGDETSHRDCYPGRLRVPHGTNSLLVAEKIFPERHARGTTSRAIQQVRQSELETRGVKSKTGGRRRYWICQFPARSKPQSPRPCLHRMATRRHRAGWGNVLWGPVESCPPRYFPNLLSHDHNVHCHAAYVPPTQPWPRLAVPSACNRGFFYRAMSRLPGRMPRRCAT